jgi:dipeptidase
VYSIADPHEAWVFEVANGKHWIARRVPDDEVAIVPNYYVIDNVHLTDTANVLSSPDLVHYAVANGWYDPQKDTPFNFREVYCHPKRFDAIWNIGRKWVVLNQLADIQYDFNAVFPFSVKPKHKVSVQTLIHALEDHYEGTVLERDPSLDHGSPHYRTGLGVKDTMSVCNLYTDYSCITQLRGWLPAAIGNIMWIAPRYPCIQPFIPWYYGIDRISSDYEKATYEEALENYNNKNRDYLGMYPGHACWVFDDFANVVDSSYGNESQSVRAWRDKFQAEISETLREKESAIIRAYASDHDKARQGLTDVSNGLAERALRKTREKLMHMRTGGR